MGIELLDPYITDNYLVKEWKHACAILRSDFPDEWQDIMALLIGFKLKKSSIIKPGGRKSEVSTDIDSFLYDRGWIEKLFKTSVIVDDNTVDSPTHNFQFHTLLYHWVVYLLIPISLLY